MDSDQVKAQALTDQELAEYRKQLYADWDAPKTVEACCEIYDKFAPVYGSLYAKTNNGSAEIAEIVNRLVQDKQAKIIDFGCGSGQVGARLKEHGFEELTGVDGSERMLEEA